MTFMKPTRQLVIGLTLWLLLPGCSHRMRSPALLARRPRPKPAAIMGPPSPAGRLCYASIRRTARRRGLDAQVYPLGMARTK